MDWAWIAWVTLRLTQRSVERIKDAVVQLAKENPGIAAVVFVVVVGLIIVWIYKHAGSLEKKPEE
jgi:hypothetical protein